MKKDFDLHRLFSNWLKDLKVAVLIVSLLIAFRFAMVIIFQDQRAEGGRNLDYLLFFFRSLLFDLRIALFIVLPTFILGFFAFTTSWSRWLYRIRIIIGCVAIILTILLCVGNIGFFGEFHEQYNHWVYGLLHDDFRAILETIWKTYPVVWIGLGATTLSIFSLILLFNWIGKKKVSDSLMDRLPCSLFGKLLILFLVVGLYLGGIRGSITTKVLRRENAGVTKDYFLNKLVLNPYFALYYTHSDNKHLNQVAGLDRFFRDKTIKEALMLLYPEVDNHSNEIDEWIKKKVINEGIKEKPKHIFLVVLESQDSWPLMEEFAWLDLAPNLRELASKGIHVKSFVSAGSTTRATLSSIITGLPDASVFTNLQPNSDNEYATAFARPFKSLGYKVNLFYGGHLSWQRLDGLAKNQGFDNMYGQDQMSSHMTTHSWGMFDDELFDYILNTIDPDVPSVNLIMTTSNHAPYPVDLQAKGCPQIICPENYKGLSNSCTDPHIMGHLWYNDYCIGQFVKKAEKRFESALFAITGDHTSRRFFSSRPSLYEFKSVPLILYGSQAFKEVAISEKVAGSHLDILPTIIERIAPAGFEYFTFGCNLFDVSCRQIGLGAEIAITSEAIRSIDGKWALEAMPWKKSDLSQIDTKYLDNMYNALHGVAWWRIMKGSKF